MKDRSEVWAMFMAATIASPMSRNLIETADRLLAEYDKRFPQADVAPDCENCKYRPTKPWYKEPK